MDEPLPNAKSSRSADERERLRRLAVERNLCGLANDTKWDELIAAMRTRSGWLPTYRYKCLDGPPSGWDADWFYHLPFPMLSVEWLDIAYLEEVREHRLPPRLRTVDHSGWIEGLLRSIGLDYRKGTMVIRIFGYSPRNLELFDHGQHHSAG